MPTAEQLGRFSHNLPAPMINSDDSVVITDPKELPNGYIQCVCMRVPMVVAQLNPSDRSLVGFV